MTSVALILFPDHTRANELKGHSNCLVPRRPVLLYDGACGVVG